MPPKPAPSPSASSPAAVKPNTNAVSSASSQPTKAQGQQKNPTGAIRSVADLQEIAQGVWETYQDKTAQRTKLLDAFMIFLMAVGAVQMLYCVIAGNYPFNAFLSGFSATVGQFVLTASLRIQTNPENRGEFKGISHERAFADFVFGSMVLHFFCVNFIN